MKKNILFILIFWAIQSVSFAQGATEKITSGGLRYIHHIENKGNLAKITDILKMNFRMTVKTQGRDTLLRNTFIEPEPFVLQLNMPAFEGAIEEALVLSSKNDSLTCFVSADKFFASIGGKPPFIDAGSFLRFDLRIVDIQSEETFKAERQAKLKAESEKQTQIEEALLKKYFAEKNIKPLQSPSGLYYTIENEGVGEFPQGGQRVKAHYTGKLLDGTKFDSSLDRGQPLEFVAGVGQMIQGFDEGILYIKKGGKATLYIPSRMGYGNRLTGSIPANSILIFEIELVEIVK